MHRCMSVACGGAHTFVVSDMGKTFSWGQGGCGQLGQGHTIAIVSTPTQVSALAGVCRVSESLLYSTAWCGMYILTPYTPICVGMVSVLAGVCTHLCFICVTCMYVCVCV